MRGFFNQWAVYQEFVRANCLCHREARRLLRHRLRAAGGGIRFLDLACGDAQTTAGALRGCSVARYVGTDFAAPALQLAAANTRGLADSRDLVEADYMEFLRGCHEEFDFVYVGLSLHHLSQHEKREFFRLVRRVLAPGGLLMCFEPVLRGEETREECLEAWRDYTGRHWSKRVGAAAMAALGEHVRTADFPETTAFLQAAAVGAGFRSMEVIFSSGGGFYAMLAFEG